MVQVHFSLMVNQVSLMDQKKCYQKIHPMLLFKKFVFFLLTSLVADFNLTSCKSNSNSLQLHCYTESFFVTLYIY